MRIILLFLLAVCLGIILMAAIYLITVIKESSQPAGQSFEGSIFSIKKAPSESINGNIVSFSGGVNWQSREATEASQLKSPQVVQQGERLTTDATGSAVVQYGNIAQLTIFANADLSLTQTLPNNFVFVQNAGSTQYKRVGNIPVSIRVLHLLIDQDLGNIEVAMSKEDQTVTVNVNKGKITGAFNDLNLVSHLLTVYENQQLIFHDDTRETEINNL